MNKHYITLIFALLISTNAMASIILDESCAQGIKQNINGIKSQAINIISTENNGGRIEYAAYLLYISAKYVRGEQMMDSEFSDVASICEVKFDIKKLVEMTYR